MKITDVKTFFYGMERQNWLFVKVETDEGLYGWGEASCEGQTKAVEQVIKIFAQRDVIGEDPQNIEKIWQKMYHHGFWKGGYIHMSAVSGIDQALWDIKGKALGVPVYQLLGGKLRDKVKAYTHAFGIEMAAQCVEMGFAGVKTGGGASFEIYDWHKDLEPLAKNLEGVRKAIGPDKIIAIDNHGQSTPAEAIRKMKVAEPYDIYFYEEPIPPENSLAYKQIREAVPTMTLAAGERLFSRFDYREIVQERLLDVVQPDICHCGGITEIRKIAAMVEPYHIKFAPHNPNGPVATAASIQVAAATQNFDILEFASFSIYSHASLINIPLRPTDGYLPIPETPGLGIELDEKELLAHPYKYNQYAPRWYPDGSVAEI
jgi:galactonate dehydratase